jgi:hypothetical protein
LNPGWEGVKSIPKTGQSLPINGSAMRAGVWRPWELLWFWRPTMWGNTLRDLKGVRLRWIAKSFGWKSQPSKVEGGNHLHPVTEVVSKRSD